MGQRHSHNLLASSLPSFDEGMEPSRRREWDSMEDTPLDFNERSSSADTVEPASTFAAPCHLVNREVASYQELYNWLRKSKLLPAPALQYSQTLCRDYNIVGIAALEKVVRQRRLALSSLFTNPVHLFVIERALQKFREERQQQEKQYDAATANTDCQNLSEDEGILIDSLRKKLGLDDQSEQAYDLMQLYQHMIEVPLLSADALSLCEKIATSLGMIQVELVSLAISVHGMHIDVDEGDERLKRAYEAFVVDLIAGKQEQQQQYENHRQDEGDAPILGKKRHASSMEEEDQETETSSLSTTPSHISLGSAVQSCS